MKNYLNFETDIKNLEIEIDKLKDPYNQDGLSEVDTKKISESQKEIDNKLQEIYSRDWSSDVCSSDLVCHGSKLE